MDLMFNAGEKESLGEGALIYAVYVTREGIAVGDFSYTCVQRPINLQQCCPLRFAASPKIPQQQIGP